MTPSDALTALVVEGQHALEGGRIGSAIDAFQRAVTLEPENVDLAIALANVLRLDNNAVGARIALQRAHRDGDSSSLNTAFALGSALLEVGAPREAAECFQRVVKSRPHDPVVLGALAGAKRASGEPTAAWPLVHQAVTKASTNPALLLTAAQVRHDLADLPGALRWLDRAEAVRPDHAATMMQRAYSMLLAAPSHAGWQQFDARPLPTPSTNAAEWRGEDMRGGSVLVTAEQGIGDQFQFARFIPLLREHGAARIVAEVHADVVSLFSASGLPYEVVARGSKVDTDWHVPMLSLPYRLATDSNVYGETVPYLRASASTARPSTGVHDADTAQTVRKFGLVWAGNPAFTGRVTRDFDVRLLPEVLSIPGIEWISLQHGADLDPWDARLARPSLPVNWAGTANMLASLDGLVTTDTGIAHLAGAMGVKTWVLLQHVPDWRWGLKGETSAWYPSATLVRQRRANDWKSVVDTLRRHLKR